MGIINCTPDSFSDGGAVTSPDVAATVAKRMWEDGAAFIDVGGESTRPGASPVSEQEERERVVPAIRAIRAVLPRKARISVDSRRPSVVAAALEAGATIINDIGGGRDPAMLALAAHHGRGIVLMHMQGEPATMQDHPTYVDVVGEVADWLAGRRSAAIAAGVDAQQVWIDPGIGFGKTFAHNLALLAALPQLAMIGRLALGVSRKRVVGGLAGAGTDWAALPAAARDVPSHVLHAQVARWCDLLRVHDVAGARRAIVTAICCRKAGIGHG